MLHHSVTCGPVAELVPWTLLRKKAACVARGTDDADEKPEPSTPDLPTERKWLPSTSRLACDWVPAAVMLFKLARRGQRDRTRKHHHLSPQPLQPMVMVLPVTAPLLTPWSKKNA